MTEQDTAELERARARRREYLICRQRGHGASVMTLTTSPPQSVCGRCGTHYREVVQIVEANVPRRVFCERDHATGVECPEADCGWNE